MRNRSELFAGKLRRYVWEGGAYPSNLTLADGTPDPKAGTKWCFVYGEKEWVDGKVFDDVKTAADAYDEEGDEKPQEGNINCVTGAKL